MTARIRHLKITAGLLIVAGFYGCAKIPVRQYYVLNYVASPTRERLNPGPYNCTVRLREFDVEEAYTKPQIVYRKSPFQLQYYVYQVWAVKPERIMTDLMHKHLITSSLVTSVVRRFDEGHKPDYELKGIIEAIEEYDSEEFWFAHIALRINIFRISDGRIMYSRRFDHRKRVFEHQPEYVVRELSSLIEYIFSQVIHDFDVVLSSEYGLVQDREEAPSYDEPLIPTTVIDSAVIIEEQ